MVGLVAVLQLLAEPNVIRGGAHVESGRGEDGRGRGHGEEDGGSKLHLGLRLGECCVC